jgi:hypothetical protein
MPSWAVDLLLRPGCHSPPIRAVIEVGLAALSSSDSGADSRPVSVAIPAWLCVRFAGPGVPWRG